MAQINKTLNNILNLIDRDVKRLKKVSKNAQLSEEEALTLTRYASTLARIADEQEREEQQLKKKYSNLTVEQLLNLRSQEKKNK